MAHPSYTHHADCLLHRNKKTQGATNRVRVVLTVLFAIRLKLPTNDAKKLKEKPTKT